MNIIASLSEEDKTICPESSKLFEKITSHVALNKGVSTEIKNKYDQRKKNRSDSKIMKLYDEYYISIVKIALKEQLNCYKSDLPKNLIQMILKNLAIRENQELKEIFGVWPVTDEELVIKQEEKEILRDIISGYIFREKVKFDKHVQDTRLLSTSDLQNVENNSENINSKLKEYSKLINVLQNKCDIINKIRELDAHMLQQKIKMLDINYKMLNSSLIMRNLNGVKREAILQIKQDVEKELKNTDSEVIDCSEKLDMYRKLPKDEFDILITENKRLDKDIENAKWTLQKLMDE